MTKGTELPNGDRQIAVKFSREDFHRIDEIASCENKSFAALVRGWALDAADSWQRARGLRSPLEVVHRRNPW